MDGIDGDQLRGHLSTLVLAALETGEAHGLEIIHRLESRGSGVLKLREGSLYPALYRLEEQGLVTSSVAPQRTGARGAPRRIYRLTRKGRGALATGRQQWQQFVEVVSNLLQPPPTGDLACQ